MARIKGLFVGQLGRGQTSAMRCAALSRLGFEMTAVDSLAMWTNASYLRRHVDQRLRKSGTVRDFNERIVDAVKREKPAFLWAEKQEYLSSEVLREIRAHGTTTIHYNPDPYYSLGWKQTVHTDEALAAFDVLVVTKRYEVEEYRRHNAGTVIYSPLGFDPVGHKRTVATERLRSDISFVGGWEPRREELLLSARAPGRTIRVWGYGWRLAQQSMLNPLRAFRLGRLTSEQRPYMGRAKKELASVVQEDAEYRGEIYEERYAAAVASSAINLGFLREICPDQHTTRSFEIPAMGGFLLGDRSDEHREFFEEGREAEFFSSAEEYREKIDYYLAHESERRRIAEAGYRRCMSSGYSYDERLSQVLSDIGIAPSATGASSEAVAVPAMQSV